MVGILVHGNNHFIVRGPLPDRSTALALVHHWSIIQIGIQIDIQIGTQIGGTPPEWLGQWRISTREFRENLEWAVMAPGDGEMSPAVKELLEELEARGIRIHDASRDAW